VVAAYIPGLNMSATYYRVGVKGIITQLSQQQNMDLCFGPSGGTSGDAKQCSSSAASSVLSSRLGG
jgi:hypothetical protein